MRITKDILSSQFKKDDLSKGNNNDKCNILSGYQTFDLIQVESIKKRVNKWFYFKIFFKIYSNKVKINKQILNKIL